jgi:hypothetical protein
MNINPINANIAQVMLVAHMLYMVINAEPRGLSALDVALGVVAEKTDDKIAVMEDLAQLGFIELINGRLHATELGRASLADLRSQLPPEEYQKLVVQFHATSTGKN